MVRLALALVALSLLIAPAADAAARKCQPRAGTVYRDGKTRVWHERKALFACTTLTSTNRPVTKRLGPWTRGGTAAVNGRTVAWTTVKPLDGVQVQRVWVGQLDGFRYVTNAPAIPASGGAPAQDGQIERLLPRGLATAWVTTTSDVVLATYGGDSSPTPIGTLPAALSPSKDLLLVGSWPASDAATLADTITLTSEVGEADDCGGSITHTLRLTPVASGPEVGVTRVGILRADPEICS